MTADDVAVTPPPTWGPARVARWAGTFGCNIPALGCVVYPIWLVPSTDASGAEVAAWAMTHHVRLVVMMALYTVGVVLWLPFGAAVWVYLRDRLGAGSPLPACFAAGFVGLVLLILSGFTVFNMLLYRDHGSEAATLLYDLAFGFLAMSGLPTAVASAAFALAVYTHRVLPRYTAHVAAAAAALHLLFLAVFGIRGGPLSLESYSIWVIPLSLFAWIIVTARAMPRTA